MQVREKKDGFFSVTFFQNMPLGIHCLLKMLMGILSYGVPWYKY